MFFLQKTLVFQKKAVPLQVDYIICSKLLNVGLWIERFTTHC